MKQIVTNFEHGVDRRLASFRGVCLEKRTIAVSGKYIKRDIYVSNSGYKSKSTCG